MKKYIKLGFVALLAITYGCNTDYYGDAFDNDTDSGWIEFESIMTTATAGSTIEIPVFQRSVTNSEPTTVKYSVAQVAGAEGSAPQELIGNFELIIPEDELQGEIVLDIPSTDENYNLLITIEGTNKDNLVLGLEGTEPNAHPIENTVSICDGTIATSYSGSAFMDDGTHITDFQATLTPVPGEDGVYTIDTAWGMDFVAVATGDPSFVGQYVYDATFTISPDKTQVTIVGNDPTYATGGSGTYDSCTKTFEYNLTQAVFTDPFTVNVTLIAN